MSAYKTEKQLKFINIAKLVLNDIHAQVFDICLGVLCNAPEYHCDVLEFMKRHVKVINIEFALKQAEKNGLAECVTFCYCAKGNKDSAVKTLVDSDGNLDQLFKLLSVTDTKSTHAYAFKFVLEKHPSELARFLPLFQTKMSPAELMQVAGLVEGNEERLYPVYFAPLVLSAEQPLDDLAVNERFLPFILR